MCSSSLRMDRLFLFTVLSCLISAVEGQDLSVKGYTGGQVHIRCDYPLIDVGQDKYFCKSERYTCVEQIRTDLKNQWVNKSRFSLFDDTSGGFFTVIFRELSAKQDSGKYFCGVKKVIFPDKRVAVDLTVTKDDCCTDPLNITSYDEETVNINCRYPAAVKKTSKFFCRGSSSSPNCTYTLETTVDQPSVQDENLKLHDNRAKSVLEVSLRNVTIGNDGFYWCGIQRNKYNSLFKKVQLALTNWCCEQTTNVTSFSEGDTTDISCPYPVGYEDQEKFFCKGENHHDCADLISINKTGVWAEKDRVSCFDNITSRRVTVMVRDLTAKDSGIYWCGFDRHWRPGNYYTRVSLTVGPVSPSPSPDSNVLVAVSVSLSVVTLLVATAIAVIIIWRRRWSHGKKKDQNMTTTATFADTNNSRQVINGEIIYDDVPPMSMHDRESVADLHPAGVTPNDIITPTYYNTEQTTEQARNASICDVTVPSEFHVYDSVPEPCEGDIPTQLCDSSIHSDNQSPIQQPLDASYCDVTAPSEFPLYDSVPIPDVSADSISYTSCVFTESTGSSSDTNTVLEDNTRSYATVNHNHKHDRK